MMQNFNSLKERFSHLELSILPLSSVLKDNETKRLDSEYFKKEYLENEEFITQKDCVQLKNTNITIKHPTEIERNYTENENSIWFIRAQNVKPLNLDIDNKVFISTQDADKLSKNLVCKNDILMTRTGSCGDCVLYLEHDKAIASSHTFIIRNSFFNQAFLSVFFACKYGKIQINKGRYGSLQPEIAPYYLKNIYVPLFDSSFQAEIEKIVKNAHHKLEQSKALYKEAENLLYESLGFLNPASSLARELTLPQNPTSKNHAFKASQAPTTAEALKLRFSHLNISIKPLSKSLRKSGRLDSEYYQAKYENIEALIKQNGFKTLQEICSLINYGSVPTSPYTNGNDGVPYIKGLNLKNLEVSEDKLDKITNTQGLHSKFFTKENDIIISQMGTVGDCGVVSKSQENYIFASFTIRVRLKDTKEFNPYFVALYIQNIAKEHYLQRNIAQASVRQNTDLPTIKNLYVPLLDSQIQGQIASKLKLGFALKEEAKELLEKAKNKVESAIENKNC